MTYSSSNSVNSVPNSTVYNETLNSKKQYLAPLIATGSVLGGAGGLYVAHKKNHFLNKRGEAFDSFARSVYEETVANSSEDAKKFYQGSKNILSMINKVKTPEELKALLDANGEAAVGLCSELNQTPEDFLSLVNEDNLKSNKKIIKEKINSSNKIRYQNMKNRIQACWDKDKKMFVKSDSVDDDIFNAINKITKKVKSKAYLKYAALGTGLTALVTYVCYKFLSK